MEKRTKRQCRILSRRAPRKLDYDFLIDDSHSDKKIASDSQTELPNPHDYPPYGGTCWRQAFDEATSLKLLVDAAKLWNWAESYMGYLPKDQRNAIFAAYVAAKAAYSLAWQVMEDCLVGQTV